MQSEEIKTALERIRAVRFEIKRPARIETAEEINAHIDRVVSELSACRIPTELREEIQDPPPSDLPEKKREKKTGSDRMERGGKDRGE